MMTIYQDVPAGDADDEQTKALRALPGFRPKENALEVNTTTTRATTTTTVAAAAASTTTTTASTTTTGEGLGDHAARQPRRAGRRVVYAMRMRRGAATQGCNYDNYVVIMIVLLTQQLAHPNTTYLLAYLLCVCDAARLLKVMIM